MNQKKLVIILSSVLTVLVIIFGILLVILLNLRSNSSQDQKKPAAAVSVSSNEDTKSESKTETESISDETSNAKSESNSDDTNHAKSESVSEDESISASDSNTESAATSNTENSDSADADKQGEDETPASATDNQQKAPYLPSQTAEELYIAGKYVSDSGKTYSVNCYTSGDGPELGVVYFDEGESRVSMEFVAVENNVYRLLTEDGSDYYMVFYKTAQGLCGDWYRNGELEASTVQTKAYYS